MKDIILQKPNKLIFTAGVNAYNMFILKQTEQYDQSRIVINLTIICNRSYANQQSN